MDCIRVRQVSRFGDLERPVQCKCNDRRKQCTLDGLSREVADHRSDFFGARTDLCEARTEIDTEIDEDHI